ncbi:unnamed protein product, partial [Heterosigma akashiwo]
CATGTEINGACYYYNEDSLSRDDAQTTCEALGGMLASIDSSDVDAGVLDLTGGTTAWIGLNDESTEGTYVWADGTSVDYTNWNTGEPNDWGDSEDCINEEIVEVTGGTTAWIGLNDESTEGTYVWADGTSSADYTNWNSGEPNDWGDSEDCVEITSSGGWNDQSCSTTQGYVCQWTVTAAPTKAPTMAPTNAPTELPTKAPTKAPTMAPTNCCCIVVMWCKNVSLLFSLYSPPPAEFEGCVTGTEIDGACYYYNEDSLSRDDAQTACEALGGMLASIDSSDVDSEVLDLTGGTTVWIGLNDESTEGTYVWADGTSVGGYTNWNTGEPNDYGDSEDCVEMTSSGGWNDNSCSNTQASVCEIPTADLRFRYYTGALSRDDAESACEAAGGMLASITSDEIDEEIVELTGGDSAWIGLNDESTEGTYVWADGTSSADYTNWNSGEPNDWGDSEDCVEITSSGGWNDQSCSTTQGYVCQWTVTAAPTKAPTMAPTNDFEGCVTGTEIDGACYYYNEDSLSRDDAQTACEALGGMLASIDSSDVDSEVLDLTGGTTVWIGLNDESTEGTYVWADGTSVGGYTNWNTGEPNDYGDSEDCVEMTSSGGWNDNSCSNTQASVCEIPTADLRFRYYTGALSRDDAESACEAAGGMLASITSDEIDEEIVELTGGDSAWIGLSDESTEGHLRVGRWHFFGRTTPTGTLVSPTTGGTLRTVWRSPLAVAGTTNLALPHRAMCVSGL